ncbi:hypothetical protein I4U23_011226, partial [Adineta vaga]
MTKNDTNTHDVQLTDIASSQTATTRPQVRREKRKYIIICVIGVIVIISAVAIITTIFLTKKKANAPATASNLTVAVDSNTTWKQNGITVAGGNESGKELNKLNGPRGFDLDDDLTLYIADEMNHRVVRWKMNAIQGEVIAGSDGKGNGVNQLESPCDVVIDKRKHSLIICDSGNERLLKLNHHKLTQEPTKILSTACFSLILDKNGYLYISDIYKGGIKRWKEGQSNVEVIAGGNEHGDELTQFMFAMYFFVDNVDGLIYISDTYNH